MTDPAIEQTIFIVDDDEAFRDSVEELVHSVGLATESWCSTCAWRT
jgi:FixJ family two-component response regulator